MQNKDIYYNHTHAAIAQMVERIHGKDEVKGSNPLDSSIIIKSIATCG